MNRQPTHILIACDRNETCVALEQMLQDSEYKTTVASNNIQIIDDLRNGKFQLAIFDLAFLESRKEQVLEQENRRSWLKYVASIIIISQDQFDSTIEWLDRTASDFLVEPLYPELLKVRLEYCLTYHHHSAGINELISFFSHDIKSPLSAIRGYTELLLDGYPESRIGPLNEKQAEFLQAIEHHGKRVQRFVEDILDYARIEYGYLFIDFTTISLKREVEAAIASVQPEVQKNSQVLKSHIPDNLPSVEGSPWRLHQAMCHLLMNACHYTPNGGQIDLTLEYLSSPNHFSVKDVIHVTTKDTGIGIPSEQQARVFTPFWQSPSIRRHDLPRTDGMGLGLYVTKAIIEAHGGQIWFESKEGEGSTFHFTLPL